MNKRLPVFAGLLIVVLAGTVVWFVQSSSVQRRNAREFFRHETVQQNANSIIGQQFFSSTITTPLDQLQANDFPNVSWPYSSYVLLYENRIETYNGRIFTNGGARMTEYNQEGKVVAVGKKFEGGVSDFALIGNKLYVAVSGKGIYEVDVSSNKITHLYDDSYGFANRLNLQLTTSGQDLWVGTFDGVARIDTAARRLTFFTKELGTQATKFSAQVRALNGEVWAVVGANVYSDGSVSRFVSSTQRWVAYSYADFANKPTATRQRLDVSSFIVSDHGVFGNYGPAVMQFDFSTGKWKKVTVTSDVFHYIASLPREWYVPYDKVNENGTVVFKLFENGKWKSIPIQGTYYYDAISKPIDDKVYLVSGFGLEEFTKGSLLPVLVAKEKLNAQKLLITDDSAAVVGVDVLYDYDYGDGLFGYSVFVYDRAAKKLVVQNFESKENELWPSDIDPYKAPVNLEVKDGGYVVTIADAHFKFSLPIEKIERID